MGVFRQSSLRALAPASLVVFAIILLIVVIASLSGGDGSTSSSADRVTLNEPKQKQRDRARAKARRARRALNRGVYVVRAGDNLFTIANRTGVPIETLRELNPTADPQGLVTGQHIRLPVPGQRGATGATGATGTNGATGAAGPG